MRQNLLEFLKPPGPRLVYKASNKDSLNNSIFENILNDDSLWIKVTTYIHKKGQVYYDISNADNYPTLFSNMSRLVLCEVIDGSYIDDDLLRDIVFVNSIDFVVTGLLNCCIYQNDHYGELFEATDNKDLQEFINPRLEQVLSHFDSILTPLPGIEDCLLWGDLENRKGRELRCAIKDVFELIFPRSDLIPKIKIQSLINDNDELADAIRRIASIDVWPLTD